MHLRLRRLHRATGWLSPSQFGWRKFCRFQPCTPTPPEKSRQQASPSSHLRQGCFGLVQRWIAPTDFLPNEIASPRKIVYIPIACGLCLLKSPLNNIRSITTISAVPTNLKAQTMFKKFYCWFQPLLRMRSINHVPCSTSSDEEMARINVL